VKITIVTDLHVGNKKAEMPLPAKELLLNPSTYLTGDIIDLARCEKNELDKYMKLATELHEGTCKGRYLSGNHEGWHIPTNDIIIGNVLLTHGDLAVDSAKWSDYRNKELGRGSGFFQWVIDKRYGHISKDEARLLAEYSKSRHCNVCISGHVHPKKIFDEMVDGVRVIVLPRGVTTLEV
jgi:predicted phosphodiesterase